MISKLKLLRTGIGGVRAFLPYANVGTLQRDRDGYKGAYETASAEVGRLRILAGPALVRTPEEARLGAGKPSILVVSLPKSGTVFVGSSLATTLGFDYGRNLTSGTFPKDIVWPQMAHDFAKGGMISTSHMQADRENIKILRRAGLTKGILLTRDPRAALYSWFHFYRERELYRAKDPDLIDTFSSWGVDRQIDFHIEEFFVDAINWLSAWLDTLDQANDLNFLIMKYDDLAADSEAYIRKIVQFYELDAVIRTAPRNSQSHFRSGKTNEWRTSLADHHIRRMNSLIPERLWQRFGWVE